MTTPRPSTSATGFWACAKMSRSLWNKHLHPDGEGLISLRKALDLEVVEDGGSGR